MMKEAIRLIVSILIGFIAGIALTTTVLPTWASPITAGAITFMVSVWLADKGW